jgi:hypothetical protein
LTPVAPDIAQDQLQELETEIRQAWIDYTARLRELTGEQYEQAESDAWELLQMELRRLDGERESLAGAVQ